MSAEFIAKTYSSDHRSTLRFIWSVLRRYPWLSVSLMVGSFANAAGAAAVPYFIGLAFTRLSESPTQETMSYVGWIAFAVFASQGLRAILQLMRNASSETYGQLIERDVRDELYASLLGKSMGFHDTLPVGEIMARVTNDVRELNLMMNPGINMIVGSGWFLILPILSAPLINPVLVITPLVFVLVHVFVQYRFVRKVHPIAEAVRVSFGRMNARLAETLDGLQVVKGAAQEEQERVRFNQLVDEVAGHFIKQSSVEARYISNLLLPLTIVIGFLHSLVLYQEGVIVIGDIVAYTGLLFLFGFPVFTSLSSLGRLALGYASAKRILSIITTETDLDQNTSGHEAVIEGEVRFEHVDFGYNAQGDVIRDVSFRVKPGQTVALVGQTGSGKTTLIKLINRIYDTRGGRVLVDGVDVRDWKLESLRSQISIIEQDIFLFSRTVAENIAFGYPDATREQIIDAAKKAQAHDFIMSFPEGYETVVGQRGVTLSGGQRQRIAIARAFLTNPPILILDDSTSAIDSATEDRIQQAIYAAAQGRTTLLITHRLSQIRWADHIVVIKNGRVAAQGTHEELLETSESYRRIFARYEGGTDNEEAFSQPEIAESAAKS